nr:MAG TPA: hypothetical protein [Caudoviricetes sp.]
MQAFLCLAFFYHVTKKNWSCSDKFLMALHKP